MLQQNNEYNYGIALLKIFAAFIIVVLHILGSGGAIESCIRFSPKYYIFTFLYALTKCGVDLFAMISGYVLIKTKINRLKIIPLWLTVFFYSFIFVFLFKFIPELKNLHTISNLELISRIFFPVASRQYWYFSCYFVMYFFLPYLNDYLLSINEKKHKSMIITIIALFSILPLFTLNRIDAISLNDGWTPLWLLGMYIIGAYLKLYPIIISKIKCILSYFVLCFISFFSKFISHFLLKLIFNKNSEIDLFVQNTSVFIVLASMSLILMFAQMNIRNDKLCKLIKTISQFSFSSYIIHVNPLLFIYVFCGRFSFLSEEKNVSAILKVLLFSAAIFVVCIIIDFIRYQLFKVLKINNVVTFFDKKLK